MITKWFMVLIVLVATPDGDKRRAEKACGTLDPAYVEQIKERVTRGIESGDSKGSILRNARLWIKEAELDAAYNGCLAAVSKVIMYQIEQDKLKVEQKRLAEQQRAKHEELSGRLALLTIKQRDFLDFLVSQNIAHISNVARFYILGQQGCPLPL